MLPACEPPLSKEERDRWRRRFFTLAVATALALAFAGTAILGTTYGFLVNAGLPDIDWGSWIWPGMVSLWVLGLVIAGRRYR